MSGTTGTTVGIKGTEAETAGTEPTMREAVAASDAIRIDGNGVIRVMTVAEWKAYGVRLGRQRKARDWDCLVYDYVAVPEYAGAVPAIGGSYTLRGGDAAAAGDGPAFWRVAGPRDLPNVPWCCNDGAEDPGPGVVKWTEERITPDWSLTRSGTPEETELTRENRFAEAAGETRRKYAQAGGVLFVCCGEPHYAVNRVSFGDGTRSLTLTITDREQDRPDDDVYTADAVPRLRAFLEEQEAHVNARGEHDTYVSATDDYNAGGRDHEWREWLEKHPIAIHDPSMLGRGVPKPYKLDYPRPIHDLNWRDDDDAWLKGYAKLIKAIRTIPGAMDEVAGVRVIDKTRLTIEQESDYMEYRDHFKTSGLLIA